MNVIVATSANKTKGRVEKWNIALLTVMLKSDYFIIRPRITYVKSDFFETVPQTRRDISKSHLWSRRIVE